jgi:alanine racemase
MPQSEFGQRREDERRYVEPKTIASWLELSEEAYAANIRAFRALAGPGVRVGAVLKGNAYGHGLLETLELTHALVDVVYVIRPTEALAIRAWEKSRGAQTRDVLVIGAASADECLALARADVQVVVGDASMAEATQPLRAEGLTLKVHVHLDTGLGREGFTKAQLLAGDADFLGEPGSPLSVRGVLSHFANTEDVTEQEYARVQLAAFDEGQRLLRERGLLGAGDGAQQPLERHFAASAAALVLPPARLDVLRVGISLYGLWPSPETRLSARVVLGLGQVPHLEPVLSWRAPSQVVKWLKAGSYIGYGCTYRCPSDTRVAVFPVGYWDGYPRLASGKAHVLVNGQRCPVLGRVMMNHLIADVTHALPADDGQPVTATLLGRDGAESISAETLAAWAQTIHYELVTRLGTHLERRIV